MRKPRPQIPVILRQSKDHGKNVYAYRNLRTNQILYSLHDTLINEDLKQLPDVGANHTPPTIRPDLWKPFYSVHVPSAKQGLRLFAKLKEWRKVHELYWTPPTELKRIYTEKEVERVKKSLESRGGHKRETVYDVIKRQKKKIRQKMILDQKANSVADLSAVLHEQQAQVVPWAREARRTVYDLAQRAQVGGLKELKQTVSELGQAITTVKGVTKRERATKRDELEKQLNSAKLKIAQMTWAVAAEREAMKWAELPIEERRSESMFWNAVIRNDGEHDATLTEFATVLRHECHQTWAQIAVARRVKGIKIDLTSWQDSEEAQLKGKIVDANDFLKLEPEDDKWLRFLPALPPQLNPGFLNTRVPERRKIKVVRAPDDLRGFSLQNVVIKWANVLDAEYAATWPRAVEITRMDGPSEKWIQYEKRKQREQEMRDIWRERYQEAKRRVQIFTGKISDSAQEASAEGADVNAELPLQTPSGPGTLHATH